MKSQQAQAIPTQATPKGQYSQGISNDRPSSAGPNTLPYQPSIGNQPYPALPEAERAAADHMFVDYVTPYGAKTKPRYMDPSMFELMQWEEAEKDYEFKYTPNTLRDMDDYRRYRSLIDKTHNGYTSEAKDNYRQFVYKKVEDGHVHIPFEDSIRPSHDKSLKNQPQKQPRRPTQVTEYGDEISRKGRHQGYDDVMREIDYNQHEREGKSNSRERRPYTGNYIRSDMLDWPDDEQMKKIRMEEHARKAEEEEQKRYEEEQRRLAEIEAERLRNLNPDYSKVQNRLLSYKVEKRRELDPEKDKDRIKRRQDRIKTFREQSRWLPNSAFQTYYGKPAFESYGMGNTHPTWGGLGYGQYMVSHNVNPHRQPNNPSINQVTHSAELANVKYDHIREKYGRTDNYVPRKTKDQYVQSESEVKVAKDTLSLDAVKRPGQKRNKSASKSADKKQEEEENPLEVKPFYKPDLMRTDVFASRDNSPRNSEGSVKGKKK